MKNTSTLWPYSKQAALLAIPVIWILSAVFLSFTRKFLSWPDAEVSEFINVVVITLGLVPLGLVLFDFVSSKRAVLDIKGVKIDFSQADMASETIGLPENIGIEGAIITDSSPMQITNALEKAIQNEIIRIGLKEGDAWWATRLLALSAGAVRAGSPKVFVFTGTVENIPGVFLGWAQPAAVLKALLNSNAGYKMTYQKSKRIAQQVNLFGDSQLLPIGLQFSSDILRYIYSDEYLQLGDAMFEQIFMDQLALQYEGTPEKITLGRFDELFRHCVYRDAVNLEMTGEQQIAAFFDAHGPYVALVRKKRYEALLKRETGESFILKQLFLQSQQTDK